MKPTEQEIKEEAKLFRINEQDDGAYCGFIAGAQWAISLQPEPTLSNDDLTGRAIKIYTMALNRPLSEFIKLYKEAYSQPPTK